jgi:hypothetical protein
VGSQGSYGKADFRVTEGRNEDMPVKDPRNNEGRKRKVIYNINRAIREGKVEPPKYGPI